MTHCWPCSSIPACCSLPMIRCPSCWSIWPSALAALIMPFRTSSAVLAAPALPQASPGSEPKRHAAAGPGGPGAALGRLPCPHEGLHGDARQHGQRPAAQRALDGVAATAEQTPKDRPIPPACAGFRAAPARPFCMASRTPPRRPPAALPAPPGHRHRRAPPFAGPREHCPSGSGRRGRPHFAGMRRSGR